MCCRFNKTLVLDEWTGRYFNATIVEIQSAMLEINQIFLHEGSIDLNTVYDRLGLAGIPMGVEFGWSASHTSEIRPVFGAHITPEGEPALTLSFRQEPRPNMGEDR
jgi:hypothetical protein